MEAITPLQSMPIALWAVAAATGLLIILLTFAIQLFYRKRLKSLNLNEIAELTTLKEKLESEINSCTGWIEEQKDELLRLKAEREEQEVIRAEIQRLEQEAAQKESGNKDLIDKVANLENQQHALAHSAERLQKEKDDLDEKIKTLGEESKEEKEVLAKIKSELVGIEKTLSLKKEEETKLLKNIEDQTTDLMSVKENIKNQNDKLKLLEDKIIKLTEEINDLEKSKIKKSEELHEKEKRSASLDTEVRLQTEKIKSIGTMPVEAFDSLNKKFFTTSEKPRNKISEKEALESLYQLTKDRGFEFPRRLQNAFHTSLKTSDTSCLTVMAGVSGTGKSAFPKMYAEAMGFYFLPLAVEPRWDSPQDLFGFLNYMENRFEPTALARSLIQFNDSPHSNEKANLKDNLLIVMLDEMNLARIEYYFSEFLSKLEMRRNANLNDIKDYRTVSTEIYAGSEDKKGIENKEPIFLYAGYNILFVGTMNEDETTQSLSDKVIDRANVLTFGKPDKLNISTRNVQTDRYGKPKHSTIKNLTKQNAWEPMIVNDWRDWIREPGGDTINKDFEKVEVILNDLNNTLSELGRPFGWRTYKSIMSYVANHPDVCIEGQSGLWPLSDQIVMRIMPKLKGLDLNEFANVFNKLDVQIKDIEDTPLTEAFEKARNNPMGFFDWRGINW
jgi:hypothetical protein